MNLPAMIFRWEPHSIGLAALARRAETAFAATASVRQVRLAELSNEIFAQHRWCGAGVLTIGGVSALAMAQALLPRYALWPRRSPSPTSGSRPGT
jgi:hypothetical protein